MKICQRSGTTECRAVIYRSGRREKKVKNEGMRRKRGWMIDARNEDELKSGGRFIRMAIAKDPRQISSLALIREADLQRCRA